MTSMFPPWAYRAAVIAALVALGGVAAWQTAEHGPPRETARQSEPQRIMGTSCRLVVVPPRDATGGDANAVTEHALLDAEAALRRVEVEMSSWIDATPVSRFNRAPAGQPLALPPSVIHVLERSRALHAQTRGAFDITCRPLIELWRTAGKRNKVPTRAEVEAARTASTWEGLILTATAATKKTASARVDLGGIAKGYGIDRAVAAMRDAGASGGLVDVGGDVRVFGEPPSGEAWEVKLRAPSGEGVVATLHMHDGAVCTSGDYFRFAQIEGQRYSHIIDPRSGRPARGVPSATVVAQDAVTADAWATALSVLGEAGFEHLPQGAHALLILGNRGSLRVVATKTFRELLASELPYPTVFRPAP